MFLRTIGYSNPSAELVWMTTMIMVWLVNEAAELNHKQTHKYTMSNTHQCCEDGVVSYLDYLYLSFLQYISLSNIC